MSVQIYLYSDESGLSVFDSMASLPPKNDADITWVDVETEDPILLSEIATRFELHELTVEDCLTPSHFPKLEDYGSYLFMIFRGLRSTHVLEDFVQDEDAALIAHKLDDEEDRYTHKVAIYLSKKFIITFRRTEVSWLDAVARQVKTQAELSIAQGTDVLAHRIVDVLIDRFLRGLSFFDNLIDNLEDQLLNDTEEFQMSKILEIKRQLSSLRQVTRDQKGIIARLAHETALIRGRDYRRYFKDVEDHALTIINTIDKQIDEIVSLRDTYFALSNAKLGDVMRILALITTVAAPLNILVGLYGMNFDKIPLAHDPYGFWQIVLIMLILLMLMVLYFRRKRWF